MPTDYRHYPPGWRAFSALIRFGRAASQCECCGHCGLHGGRPHGNRCTERHHEPARWARGLIRLSIAHLCDCDPPCATASHVLAMCQCCHLRFDRFKHARNRLANARARAAVDRSPVPR